MRKHITVMLAAAVAFATVSPAFSADVDGLYLRKTADATSKLRVFDCGGGKGVKVEESSNPDAIGRQLMCGAKLKGNRYHGSLLNLEDGKKYKGHLQVKGSTLILTGCALGGLICKSAKLPRAD